MKKHTTAQISPEFWQGKSVIVTGHTGFKGGWLALWLHTLGAKVIGYALEPSTTPSFFAATHLDEIIESIIGDVRDMAQVQRIFDQYQPDIVFHLAAQPLVRASYAAPLDTFSSNVMGTANVLEAVRHTASVRAVVVITTDKVYENKEWVWSYRENDTLGGHDPYSASKAASELVIASYQRSFFSHSDTANVASARAGNVIGGGDWAADRIVPDIIRSIQNSTPLKLRYPDATRPWQYVLEPLSGYILLAQYLHSDKGGQFAEPWNFGPIDGNNITVRELVDMIQHLWRDLRLNIEYEEIMQPHEANLLRLDCSKVWQRLGWEARYSTQDAVYMTVEWYKTVINDERDILSLSKEQIYRYSFKE